MAKKVESIKHTADTRVHIRSKKEAGNEDANDKKIEQCLMPAPLNPFLGGDFGQEFVMMRPEKDKAQSGCAT